MLNNAACDKNSCCQGDTVGNVSFRFDHDIQSEYSSPENRDRRFMIMQKIYPESVGCQSINLSVLGDAQSAKQEKQTHSRCQARK